MKRLLSMLLSMAIVVSGFAPTVYADETHIHDNAVQQTATAETQPVAEPVTETETVTAETAVTAADLPSNDELFSLYVESKLYGNEISLLGTAARESLNDAEKGIYDFLKANIQTVAANGGSTAFTLGDLSSINGLKYQWTSEELGTDSISDADMETIQAEFKAQFDFSKIIDALLHDCPYDLYWYDKTAGCTYECEIAQGITADGLCLYVKFASMVFSCSVAANYAADSTSVTGEVVKVQTAADNAAAVVTANEAFTDLEKLTAYRDYICNAVSYNYDATQNGDFSADNDPWQLIYVFDNDSSTNVVCEGYAKSFQYLCDLSAFDSTKCYTVTGTMTGGTGAGGHMWNIVAMNDGKNYLADITNSDSGSVGQDGGLFLDGVSGSVESGYTATVSDQSTLFFDYSDDTLALWDSSILTLSDTKYTVSAITYTITVNEAENGTVTVDKAVAEKGETVTVTATPDQCYALEKIYVNGSEIEGTTFTAAEDAVITATFTATHTEETIPAVEATCTQTGLTEGIKCSLCGEIITAQQETEILGHSFTDYINDENAECTEDSTETSKCDRCDVTDTRTVENSALGHSFTEYISNGDGTQTAKCDRCDATDTINEEITVVAGGSCGENIIWTVYSDGSFVISGSGAMTDFTDVLPWEEYLEAITKVTFEGEITYIGSYSLAGLTNVTEITLPDSVTAIGEAAFDSCTALTAIQLPSGLKSIASAAFTNCDSLVSLVVPEGVTTIGYNAFAYCEVLSYIYIPATVTSVGDIIDGFAYGIIAECPQLKTAGPVGSGANIEFGWTAHIPDRAFCDGGYLENIIWPEGIATIGDSAFAYCTSLTSVTMPDSVTKAGIDAFTYCTGLTDIKLSANLEYISDGMFFYCPSLIAADIPKGVSYIGSNAFECCEALSDVTIPATVNSIGYYAFYNCPSLTAIEYTGSASDWAYVESTDSFDRSSGGAVTIYCTMKDSGIWRVAGATRYETSYEIADATLYSQDAEKFDTIIIASGAAFADALSGSYLAKVKNAPIIMANGKNNAEIYTYVNARLTEGGTVYILGGTAALPSSVDAALAGFNVKRLAGETRFETNIMILKEAGVTTEDILISTGYHFADSLSASATGRPIFLINSTTGQLTDQQKEYLSGLSGNKFYILGGDMAVSSDFEAQFSQYGEVERIGGATRHETSVMIADKFFANPESAVFAYSYNFPDGLCGGPLALSLDSPLILTNGINVEAAQQYVQENGLTHGFVLGGSGFISDSAVRVIYNLPNDYAITKW